MPQAREIISSRSTNSLVRNPKKKVEIVDDEEVPMPDDYVAMLHEDDMDNEKNTK